VRSRPELFACVWLLAAAPAWSAGEPLTQAEITRAIETVKADPDLVTERMQRQLVWDDEPDKPKPAKAHWWQSIADLFGWLAGISQMLMWLVIAALVAILVLVLVRLLASARPMPRTRNTLAPTHVRDMDIRPESLPADIGAAARKLWETGEHRAALALLYRGMLSRLAHSYAVPIRDSSTEGDCLALASRVLDTRRLDYIARLIRTWQLAIYAGRSIEDNVVYELCDGFDGHLPDVQPSTPADRIALTSGASA
jgi:hypothetical protein